MKLFLLFLAYAFTTLLDWLHGLLLCLVIYPAQGITKAVWLALQWPVVEFRLWCFAGHTDEYEHRLNGWLADWRKRWIG